MRISPIDCSLLLYVFLHQRSFPLQKYLFLYRRNSIGGRPSHHGLVFEPFR